MPKLPGSYVSLTEYTNGLCQFIDTPLIRQITGGIHVNDALIYQAWEALPKEWTTWWDSLPDHRPAQQDLIDSIDEDTETINAFPEEMRIQRPESLTAWLKKLKSFSLPRTQHGGDKLLLPKFLTSRMNSKKIVEVAIAAAYIHRVCQASKITHVIDMGSGQGYLSLTLAVLFPHLHILAIDGSETQIAGSKACARAANIPEDRLTHLVRYIDGTKALAPEMQAWANGEKCMLVGLHACGRLSEHMVRCFIELPFVTSLAAIGCCYNHIIPLSPETPDGFPISARLRERGVILSPTALMTGCQAPNNWERPDLTKESSNYSRRHFFRSLLEKVFHDKGIGPQSDQKQNWGIRKGDLASFVAFARRAMHCLGVSRDAVSDEELVAYQETYEAYEGRIAILWTLSILCCKLIESVIAMDRYWFLVEQGALQVDILPIFDYNISPRNLMMVAEKSIISKQTHALK